MLTPRLSLPVIKILSVQLIRYPDPSLLDQLYARFRSEHIPFNTESAGVIVSLLCATGASSDWVKFAEIRAAITGQTGSSQAILAAVEAFFRGQSSATRITSLLPALPLPIEVNYALITRYPGPPPRSGIRSP